MRDIALGDTFDVKFTTTAPDTGAPTTLSGTPVVSAYVGNGTTQITAGITLSVDFDSVTGLNNVRVVATSGNGFADNTDVALVITTGTVDGNSAVGYVIEQFTIGRSAAYRRLGAPAGASVSADIAAIEAQTDDIGAAGAGLTAVPWNSAWDAEVQSEVADALAVYDPPTNAELTAAVANVSVDEIQATALADLFNTDSGTTYASAVAGSVVKEIADNAGGSSLTAGDIADAVWDEAQADHVTAGSFGEVATEVAAILVDTGTTLDGKLDTIDSNVDAILVDTAEIGAAGAGLTEAGGTGDHLTAIPWNAAWDAEVQSEATDALNAYDPPTRAELTSDIGTVTTALSGLNDLSAAEVNAEVVDVLNTDTYAEPGQGAPGATITLAAKIGYLYKAWRNRSTQTATEYALYADDATTKDQEAAVSDNGTTLDRGEVTTGA